MPGRQVVSLISLIAMGGGLCLAWKWESNKACLVPRATLLAVKPRPLVPPATRPSGADVSAYRRYIDQLKQTGLDDGTIRARVTEELCAHFRQEQYLAEIAFAQMCYPTQYWESAPEMETILAVEKARLAELGKLNDELAAKLSALFGADVEAPRSRPSLFSSEMLPPKIDFLAPASREQFERELMAADPEARMSSSERMAIAERVLAPAEYALYVKWNSPAATALRDQTVEFAPSRPEYDAIFEWKKAAGSEDGFPDAAAKTAADGRLTAALGADRAKTFLSTEDPGYQTTVGQLRRLGLPLHQTTSVLALRQQASEAVRAAWHDPVVPAEMKAKQVEGLRQAYRRRFAEMFRISADLLPDEVL